MFKSASKSQRLKYFAFAAIMLAAGGALAQFEPDREAIITHISSETRLIAESKYEEWYAGETLAVVSANPKLGVIAFVEVVEATEKFEGRFEGNYEINLVLKRQNRKYFVRVGDTVKRLDLSTANREYAGSTELLLRDSIKNTSSRYRPLVHQGIIIGDTAQTLFDKEFLVNYFGNLYYGINDWFTVGTLVPVNAFGRPNANFRAKVYDSEATTLTTGLSFVKLSQEEENSLNLNLYWDATSTDALISHTFLSLGLVNWTNSGEAAALKYLTSSSFQTGYEVILNKWDRFLIGPSFNFETKALGGYLSYIWMFDRLHVQVSLNATDVTHLRLDPTDGYYGFFDMFWRF